MPSLIIIPYDVDYREIQRQHFLFFSFRLNDDAGQSCKRRPKLLTFQTYPYKNHQEKVIDHKRNTTTMQQIETGLNDKHQAEYLTNGISPPTNMSDLEEEQNEKVDEMDDDPGKLLNEWLGELNTLKQVMVILTPLLDFLQRHDNVLGMYW